MRKLIILFILFLGLMVQAQNNFVATDANFGALENRSLIDKMIESNSLEEIKGVAEIIVLKSKAKYDFYKTIRKTSANGENYQYVVYTIAGMTEESKKEITTNDYKDCIVVKFKEWSKGENPDLQIKGQLVYYFKEVSGKFLDLDQFWITTFYPSSTPEQILENYKLQEYRVNKDLKYKFKKNYDDWVISKSY